MTRETKKRGSLDSTANKAYPGDAGDHQGDQPVTKKGQSHWTVTETRAKARMMIVV
jgi:hypothetical protein